MYSHRKYNHSLESQLAEIPEGHHLLQDSIKFKSIILGDQQKKTKHKHIKNKIKQQQQLYLRLRANMKKHKSHQFSPANRKNNLVQHIIIDDKRQTKYNRANSTLRSPKEEKFMVVKSKQEEQLMSTIRPSLPIILDNNSRQRIKSPIHQLNEQNYDPNLTTILNNKSEFMKTYFAQLKYHKVNKPEPPINFEFPQVKVGQWIVDGYIVGDHIILKGKKKNGKGKMKKYPYVKVFEKVRKNYEEWAQDKFCFEA